MIVGIDKIKDMEFSFPIKNAERATYKVVSVNELNQIENSKIWKGTWGAVILAKDTKQLGYTIPDHIVFTIEYDNKAASTYRISCITSDNDTAKIEVSKIAVSTPENFFKSLKEVADLIQFII
jgi:hypothetical protein